MEHGLSVKISSELSPQLIPLRWVAWPFGQRPKGILLVQSIPLRWIAWPFGQHPKGIVKNVCMKHGLSVKISSETLPSFVR